MAVVSEKRSLVAYEEEEEEEEGGTTSDEEYIVPQKRARLQNSGVGTVHSLVPRPHPNIGKGAWCCLQRFPYVSSPRLE